MRAIAFVSLLLLFALPVSAQTILFQESFEEGFDGSGWTWTDGAGDGEWTTVTSVAPLGTGLGLSSLQITGQVGNVYLSKEFSTSMRNTVASAWFFDDMSNTLETFVSVSADPNYQSLTNQHLKVGTSCAYDGGNYTVVEGWHAEGYFVGPARALGWHQVEFKNVDGQNQVFLDDQLLYGTTFQGDWRHLILNEDNHCTTGSSWFDGVLVWREEPVSVERSAWGAIKALYIEP